MVVLSIYEPAVSCFGERFATESTGRTLQDLLSMIPVNTDRQMFGPEGEPGVQVVVPIVFRSPDPCKYNTSFTDAVQRCFSTFATADVL